MDSSFNIIYRSTIFDMECFTLILLMPFAHPMYNLDQDNSTEISWICYNSTQAASQPPSNHA